MLTALGDAGHQVIPVGIERGGNWFLADASHRPLRPSGRPVSLRLPEGTLVSGDDEIAFDVVFPVLHGPYGEDGTMQGALEIADVPYVGCGVTASAIAMEKDFAKQLFAHARIPTARWRVVHAGSFEDDPGGTVDDVVRHLGLPVFVKPAELGSSVGISKVDSEAGLKDGIRRAMAYGEKVIAEEYVVGREIEVAVLDGPRASMAGEIVIETAWYDYDSKYNDNSSRFVAPASLTSSQMAAVRTLAERAFTALGCRGLARVDFFFEEGGRGFLINEVNTMPGFTPISGFPAMWQATGMTYRELCDELVRSALT